LKYYIPPIAIARVKIGVKCIALVNMHVNRVDMKESDETNKKVQ
jgi:hypothetical protein